MFSGGVLWFHVCSPFVRRSVVRPYVFLFSDDNVSKDSQTWVAHWYSGDISLDR